MAALAERRPEVGVPTDVAQLAELFRFRDFPHFIEIYDSVTSLVATAEDIAIVIDELAADLARQKGPAGTTRNWRTVTKLLAMAEGTD